MEAEDGRTQWIGAMGKRHVLMILTFLTRQPHVSGGTIALAIDVVAWFPARTVALLLAIDAKRTRWAG